MSAKLLEENGIKILSSENKSNLQNCSTFYNHKMKICREFVLVCLGAYIDGYDLKPDSQISCLDAFGAQGINGLLWKYHFNQFVHVTINDNNADAIASIQQNCVMNEVDWQQNTANHSTLESCGKTVDKPMIDIVQSDANVLMHQKQFHFLHIDPFGSTVTYLDAAFRNVFNNGVIILTSTDIATLYNTCPRVLKRNYDAASVKSDYLKEIAARIVLAAAVRAAARCNKGIEVLFVAAAEHYVQVAVKVKRGAQQADASMANINTIYHCPLCQQWRIKSSSGLAHELSNLCGCENSGDIVKELGPMWCGGLFHQKFLSKMIEQSKKLNISVQAQQLLLLLADEALCSSSPQSSVVSCASAKASVSAVRFKRQNSEINIPGSDKNKLFNDAVVGETESYSTSDNQDDEPVPKKPRLVEQEPMFYYDLHARRVKGANIPRTTKMVHRLRQLGYKASCTHFNSHAVRTSASPLQLCNIMMKS